MKKKYFIIIFCLLLVILITVSIYFTGGKKTKVLPSVTRNLNQEQKKIYDDRIKKAEDYLKSLSPSTHRYRVELISTYINLGQQYYGLGELQKSKEMYEKALKIEPRSESALISLSITLTEGGDILGAIALQELVLENNGGNFDVWIRYIQLKKDTKATLEEIQSIYMQALEKTDNHIDLLTSKAQFEQNLGNFEQAIVLWNKAITINPENVEAYKQEIKRLQNIPK